MLNRFISLSPRNHFLIDHQQPYSSLRFGQQSTPVVALKSIARGVSLVSARRCRDTTTRSGKLTVPRLRRGGLDENLRRS